MTKPTECCRLERYKYAIYTRFREPKLYKMAVKGDWDMIPSRCLSHPKEARYIHNYGSKDTALHRILQAASSMVLSEELDHATLREMEKIKLQAVSALLEANRMAASTADAFGRTPLHLASMDVESCGEAATFMMVEAHPDAAGMRDTEGRTPLHYLVARNDQIPPALLLKVLQAYPKAVDVTDIVKETPVDIVEARMEELEDAETVLRILKTGIFPPTKHPSQRSSSEPTTKHEVAPISTRTTST
eukprot:CAMPEP_0194037734 /NCGR_PEP_ID=MMETSP0009_2-20130614/10058_1 /TAXON_ID=210454 /ORGANISM="Grammatophora oceanica, Strain CCMP 410" /LENGTH=245 /DNA_ID=CAMNT_0038679997 /DNA_START=163 /DNA_END=896 /DNA_ORIENTATION=+